MFGDAKENLQTSSTEWLEMRRIDFGAGYSVGLFVDQRENRRYLRQVAPKRLLNCFAYTCSFSVAAASVGAKTVNVDLSKKSLARGRENFALNSLPTNDHRFIADDVLSVLPRLARKGEKFDMIILDPPTFSRSHRGKAFQVESDFEKLLLAALEVADRRAHILLSTNCSSFARTRARSDGALLPESVAACRNVSSRTSPARFPAGRRSQHGLVDFALTKSGRADNHCHPNLK